MQQSKAICQAAGRHENVDLSPDGHTGRSQAAEVSRRFYRLVGAADDDLLEGPEPSSGLVEAFVIFEALQDFGKYQIADHQPFDAEIAIQPLGLSMRGLDKVQGEWAMVMLAWNVKRLPVPRAA